MIPKYFRPETRGVFGGASNEMINTKTSVT